MNINWFPGHMTKSMRMIESSVKSVDFIIYVLDSRAPYSCLNPDFEKFVANKPVVYALNKADLGLKSRVDEWLKSLSGKNRIAVTTVSTASGSASAIITAASRLCGEKLERYRKKGVKQTIRGMILGVPNCGKSTLINCLCNSGKTVTGNRAGVTRGKQWVRVNDYLELLDTPGTLYPKLVNQTVARRLAFIGSIRDEVTDTTELALELIEELKAYDESVIETRYKISSDSDANTILESAAHSRGCLLKGGVPDIDRMAVALLDDFRKGRLGKITLEKAEDYDLGTV